MFDAMNRQYNALQSSITDLNRDIAENNAKAGRYREDAARARQAANARPGGATLWWTEVGDDGPTFKNSRKFDSVEQAEEMKRFYERLRAGGLNANKAGYYVEPEQAALSPEAIAEAERLREALREVRLKQDEIAGRTAEVERARSAYRSTKESYERSVKSLDQAVRAK